MSSYLLQQRNTFKGTCASGGTWYACSSGSGFVGCCTSDPCDNGCAQSDLEPVTFDKDDYGTLPGANCTSALFYTCANNTPPFWGCCKSNPCTGGDTPGGCPSADLTGAFIDSPGQSSAFLTSSATSTSTSTSASSNAKPTITGPATSKATSSAKKASNTAVIAGSVVGGVLGLCLVLALVLFVLSKRRKRSRHLDAMVGPYIGEAATARYGNFDQSAYVDCECQHKSFYLYFFQD